jgi:hypothetical protein
MIKRAIGLMLDGLDNGMSQHYSTQDQARSLLTAEAGLEINMETGQKSTLYYCGNSTTGCDLQLPIRLYVNHEWMT